MFSNIRIFRTQIFLACSILMVSFANLNAQSVMWKYAYAVRDETQVLAYSVSPTNISARAAIFQIEYVLSDNLQLAEVEPSPNGSKVALIYNLPNRSWKLHVLDLLSDEVIEVFESQRSSQIDKLAWSPNSQFIAFSASDDPAKYEDLYIYTVASDSIENITNDTTILPVHFIWSSDSSKIALYQVNMVNAECVGCAGDLSIYDLNNQNMIPTTDLSIPANYTTAVPTDLLCNLQWSPSGRYLSFTIGCEWGIPFHKEVYIISLDNRELKSLTPYTGREGGTSAGRQSDFPAIYASHWYDDSEILIGINVSNTLRPPGIGVITPIPPIIQTVLYDISQDTSSILLQTDSVLEWGLSSTDGNGTIGFVTASNPVIQVARISQQNLNILGQLSEGCNLDWSPDGVTLSYFQ